MTEVMERTPDAGEDLGPIPAVAPPVEHHPHVTRTAWIALATIVVVGIVAVVVAGIVVPPRDAERGRAVAATRTSASEAHRAATAAGDEAPTTTSIPTLLPPAPPPPSTPIQLPGGRIAPLVSRVPTTDRVIFLGIDDGLVRDPKVLEFFARERIPFTMFLTQPFALEDTAFWKQAVAAGGTIQAHTVSHTDLRKLNWNQLRREICGPADKYAQVFGTRPTLFRPPYGLYDDRVRATAASCGYKAVVMWRGSTNDGRLDLAAGTQLQPGDVLLMHFRNDLLANLDAVIARCREQGFTIARLEDYLG